MAVYLGNIAQTEYQCFAIPVMIRKWTRFPIFGPSVLLYRCYWHTNIAGKVFFIGTPVLTLLL